MVEARGKGHLSWGRGTFVGNRQRRTVRSRSRPMWMGLFSSFLPPSGSWVRRALAQKTPVWKVECNLSTLNCTEPAAWAPSALLGRSEDQTYPDNFPRWPHLCPVYYFSLPAISFPSKKKKKPAVFEKDVVLFLCHSEFSYSYLNHMKMTFDLMSWFWTTLHPTLHHFGGRGVYVSFQGHEEIKPNPYLLSPFLLPESF